MGIRCLPTFDVMTSKENFDFVTFLF